MATTNLLENRPFKDNGIDLDEQNLTPLGPEPEAEAGNSNQEVESASPPARKIREINIRGWAQNRIQEGVQSVNDWSALQKNIRAYPARVKGRMVEIEKQFTVYRLTYASLSYKTAKVEEDILGVYNNIVDNIPRLEQRTTKRALFLHTNAGLRDLYQAWENLSSLQDALSRLLEHGPRKLEFYNRMVIYREEKRRIAVQHRQNESRINSAYEAVKKAMSFVDRQTRDDGPIFFGNEILTLEDAKATWNGTIENLLKHRDDHSLTTETVLGQMRSLEETIRDFPSLSKHLQRTAERFTRVISYHDLLVSSGKRVIPQPEIARASVMMYEQVPEHWTAGNFQELKLILERVENFLGFYENTVEMEVAVGERRRSGFTQNLAQSILPSAVGLSPLIGLARVLVNAIDQRDRFMIGHSEKVADLAVATGKKLNWAATDLEFLEIAGLLHDVGKISIPESVLTKVKPLTEEDWKTIQMHPYYGAQIIKQVNLFNRIIPWVYHHQEHWDGTGYPEQLSRQEIPQASSIIGITEAFTAMTSEQPYHPAVTPAEAVELIKQDAGKQFDPELVEAFEEIISEGARDRTDQQESQNGS